MKDMQTQLVTDLEAGGDESCEACAVRLVDLGYRMPECPDRWQVDRLTGAIFGASRTGASLAEIAETLLNVVGVTRG